MKSVIVLVACAVLTVSGCIDGITGYHISTGNPYGDITYDEDWPDDGSEEWPDVDWPKLELGALYGAVWADSIFVAVGDKIITSRDGIVFDASDSGGYGLSDVVTMNGRLLAFGSPSRILVSDSLPIWREEKVEIDSLFWRGAACSDKGCIAIGCSPATNYVLYSSDGITWKDCLRLPYSLQLDVIWDGHQFMVSADSFVCFTDSSGTTDCNRRVGIVLTSPDGVTWESRLTGRLRGFYRLSISNGQYLAVAQRDTAWYLHDIMTSADGITWTVVSTVTDAVNAITSDGTTIIVACYQGGTARIAADGSTTYIPIATSPVQDVTCGNGMFLAVAKGAILTSTNGETWEVKWRFGD